MILLPLLQRFWPYIAGVALVLGVLGYVYYKGGEDERDRNAKATQEEIQKQTDERAKIDQRDRQLSDPDATERLRPKP